MKETCQRAVDTWGQESQISMMIQEMAELTKELTDVRRNRTSKENLATEIADVYIMLEQMKYLFSKKYDKFEDLVEIEIKNKIEKLKRYLKM